MKNHVLKDKLHGREKFLLILSALAIATLLLCTQYTSLSSYFTYLQNPDSYRINELADSILTDSLQNDPLSLHFFFADNQSILHDTKEAVWDFTFPVYQANSTIQEKSKAEKLLSQKLSILNHINYENLSRKEQLLYTFIQNHLESEQESLKYPYLEQPLSPSSGIQIQLPLLLAEYTFRKVEDIDSYLSMLSSIPDYLSGIAIYEEEQTALGVGLSDEAIDDLLVQLDTILNKQELTTSTHFLQTSFEEKINDLLIHGNLSAQEKLNLMHKKELFLAENNRILTTLVAPAYTALGDSLLLLQGNGLQDEGLCKKEKGIAYYSFLLSNRIGSNRSVADYRELIMQQLQADFTQMQEINREIQSSLPVETANLLSAQNPLTTPKLTTQASSMLEHLSTQATQFPVIDYDIHTCAVKEVHTSLAPFSAPAFYCIPPIDEYQQNTIYLNPLSQTDSLTLYTTMAHEGYPGHLYQTQYQRQKNSRENYHPLISLLQAGYTGYIEGWASYVEFLSYEYAPLYYHSQLASSTDAKLLTAICQLSCLQRRIQLCMLTLLDFAIHADGITQEETATILSDFGFRDSTVAKNIYTSIVREPATYPSYCIGYLEFCQLKGQAQDTWQDAYSDYRFHTLILDYGPIDFPTINQYIKKQKTN